MCNWKQNIQLLIKTCYSGCEGMVVNFKRKKFSPGLRIKSGSLAVYARTISNWATQWILGPCKNLSSYLIPYTSRLALVPSVIETCITLK